MIYPNLGNKDAHLDPPDIPDMEDDDELLSTCCGANARGEIHEQEMIQEDDSLKIEYFGICSWCREHAEFKGGESC